MYKSVATTKLSPLHRRELQKTIPFEKCFFFFLFAAARGEATAAAFERSCKATLRLKSQRA